MEELFGTYSSIWILFFPISGIVLNVTLDTLRKMATFGRKLECWASIGPVTPASMARFVWFVYSWCGRALQYVINSIFHNQNKSYRLVFTFLSTELIHL